MVPVQPGCAFRTVLSRPKAVRAGAELHQFRWTTPLPNDSAPTEALISPGPKAFVIEK